MKAEWSTVSKAGGRERQMGEQSLSEMGLSREIWNVECIVMVLTNFNGTPHGKGSTGSQTCSSTREGIVRIGSPLKVCLS